MQRWAKEYLNYQNTQSETKPKKEKKNNLHPTPYEAARLEHVVILRKEGLTFKEIGGRLGVSGQRARDIHQRHERKMQWLTRKSAEYISSVYGR